MPAMKNQPINDPMVPPITVSLVPIPAAIAPNTTTAAAWPVSVVSCSTASYVGTSSIAAPIIRPTNVLLAMKPPGYSAGYSGRERSRLSSRRDTSSDGIPGSATR